MRIGRDKLLYILSANHLLIQQKCSSHVTTNCHHRFRQHQNLILGLEKNKPQSSLGFRYSLYWQTRKAMLFESGYQCIFEENNGILCC